MFGTDDRSWIKVGAPVAIINTGGWNGRIVGQSTIEKILKTQIVLANGRRYKVSDLHEFGSGDSYYADQIVAADSPRVANIKAATERRDLVAKANRSVDEWSHSRESVEHIDAVIEAMQALRANVAVEEEEED